MSHWIRLLSQLFLALCLSMPAWAATYYVALTGSDSNPGTEARPLQTLNAGVGKLTAGDTLYIRGGTWNPGSFGQHATGVMPSGTSWSNAITIAAYPGETVILAGPKAGITLVSGESYISFDRLTINASGSGEAIHGSGGTHHIRFQDGEVYGGPTKGMLITGDIAYMEVLRSKIHDAGGGTCTDPYGCYAFYYSGHHGIFDGNTLWNIPGMVFHLFSSGQSNVSHNILRNNTIYNSGYSDPRGYAGCGIILASGGNNMAYNNVIYNNACGIQIDYTRGATNNQVYNNTVYQNKEFGISVGASAVGTIVKNNITYSNKVDLVNEGDASAIMANNLTIDPLFVNAAAKDFRLQAGSPAMNAGAAVTAVATDIQGMARPQGSAHDIGAYEYEAAGSVPPGGPLNFRVTAISPTP